MKKRLYKGENKMIFGVCAGIGEYFDVDPTIVRLITVVFALLPGLGLLAYLIAALIMPEKGKSEEN